MPFLNRLAGLRTLWSDARGNALMLTALALPVAIGAAGLGVHTMQLAHVKRELQREADSAAMAGAYSLYQDQTNSTATAQANKALTQNALVPGATATITPGAYTSGSTTYASAMYVRLVSTQPTALMALFGRSTSTVAAEARAAVISDGKVCFLALEAGNTTGITFAGNSTMNLGCGAGTNSKNSSQAINVNGQPIVNASPLVAMGGIASANYASGTVLLPNHAALSDPFSGNSYNPTASANGKEVNNLPCKSGNQWKSINISSSSPPVDDSSGSLYPPGCYGTINIQGTLTLKSGTYFLVESGNSNGLQIGAQAHFTCLKCTFVLTSATPSDDKSFATMNINGGAEVHLSAADSGAYNGISIYRDSRAAADSITINGNANSSYSGAFYFPKDTLTFNGNSDTSLTGGMSLTCFQMVALRLSFSGNSTITNTCDPPGGANKWSLTAVRLIG